MPDPIPDDDLPGGPAAGDDPGAPRPGPDDAPDGDEHGDPEQRVKDELDRIFLANMRDSEAPWKTWKQPTSREEAGPWWRPFAYLALFLALAVVLVVAASR